MQEGELKTIESLLNLLAREGHICPNWVNGPRLTLAMISEKIIARETREKVYSG
jgi:hypothetical protein